MIWYAPALKDKEGNRMIVLEKGRLFASVDELLAWKLASIVGELALLCSAGLSWDGTLEVELDEELRGNLPHVPLAGPWRMPLAVVAGPLFEEAVLTAGGQEGDSNS